MSLILAFCLPSSLCFAVLKAVVSHQGMKNASLASKVQSGICVEAIKHNHMNLICSQHEAVTKGLMKAFSI